MKINISINVEEITKTKRGRDILGEMLRNIFFDQTDGNLGCYSSFKFNNDVKTLPDEIEKTFTEDEIVYKCAEWNGIKMRYNWDGDGFLDFVFENGTMLYNDDCKKTYGWELTV